MEIFHAQLTPFLLTPNVTKLCNIIKLLRPHFKYKIIINKVNKRTSKSVFQTCH